MSILVFMKPNSRKKSVISFFALIILYSCMGKATTQEPGSAVNETKNPGKVSLVVLGNLQDAGSPHIACKKDCCASLFDTPDATRKVVSLGIIDTGDKKTYLFEATPDISEQLKVLKEKAPWGANELPDGVFITHAHIGHYTGLMYLGKEATNANGIPIFAMPKMKVFLETNGPWSQLVTEENIKIQALENNKAMSLSANLEVVPFTVPHRDEYSETVGYTIIGPNKRVLFIPDIDKWQKWETSITAEIAKVDYAFLDATFYDGEEINTRDISQIPHPFVIESMALFQGLSRKERQKIHFIHFNHTNPLLQLDSPKATEVTKNGFMIARMGQKFEL